MSDVPLTLEDEEFLEVLSKIDNENDKNIIIGYLENIKKNQIDALRKFQNDLNEDRKETLRTFNIKNSKELDLIIKEMFNKIYDEVNKIFELRFGVLPENKKGADKP